MFQNTPSTPLQQIVTALTEEKGVKLFIKREDMIHPYISGNKWRKLKYNIEEVKEASHKTLLTFGGAYSNHVVAVAYAGKALGIETIGVIRGEKYSPLNPQLQFASDCGMKLHYISRKQYRNKEDPNFINELKALFREFYLLPEGGDNELGIKGCTEIIDDIEILFDYICCACGTGATLKGIALSLREKQKAIGFSVLKNAVYIEKKIKNFVGNSNQWSINHDYHFGGYAKTAKQLDDFINQLSLQHQIPVEPVYTGKLLYGIFDLIQRDFFKKDDTIIAIHTGGVFNY